MPMIQKKGSHGLRKRVGLLLTSGIFIAVFFQNCAPPNPQIGNSEVQNDDSVIKSKVDLKEVNKISLWDVEKGILLDVNPRTGDARSFENFGEVASDRYCLSQQDLAGLNAILSSSDICEPSAELSQQPKEFQVCTMIYRFPYASLHMTSREVRLGEQVNGCEVPVDLCGNQGAQLAAWSQAILGTLNLKDCK